MCGGYKLCICPITFSLSEIMHQNIPNITFVIQVQGTLCKKERREDSSIHFYTKSCLNNIKENIIIFMIHIIVVVLSVFGFSYKGQTQVQNKQ